ncbi:MAG: RIP metalloprotease RseP [Chlamydiae bacterium CG10_big_fil_rev_8_21_14_0_10_35_9]|nr:MAG: RIP metalloprotease RseP [Chlamydiae bacterium CG10_big_fil_rev_8_21_14_0_10_35_9]
MITILLAILGLGALVFIHELGHYWVARKVGMRVEAFSIGFGKAIYKFKRKGVEWKIGILPFGGYVKIAGMQKENGVDPHDIPDGFFGKKPLDRIKVAFAGPLFNIILAFLAFTLIWALGGQKKDLSQFTNRIGYIDTESVLYKFGVRPGDQIVKYDNHPYRDFRDIIIPSLSKNETIPISVNKIDYFFGKDLQRYYNLYSYQYDSQLPLKTIGVLSPAGYVIFDKASGDSAPINESGIQKGDRIVWLNGELVFSHQQLNRLINQKSAFITIERNGAIHQTTVPTLPIKEFKLSLSEKNELSDWAYEAKIKDNIKEIAFLPFIITTDNKVEYPISLIDPLLEEKVFENAKRNPFHIELETGDKIVAVNGVPVNSSYDLLKELQVNKTLMVVQRNPDIYKPIYWNQANQEFTKDINFNDLKAMVSSIGVDSFPAQKGNLYLLKPVVPQPLLKFHKDLKGQNESLKNMLFLGMQHIDKPVIYNPNPFELFQYSFSNIYRTLSGLISGTVAPKHLSGPVGIIQAVQMSWAQGVKEALFWLGFISLNLAIVNLLPIPVLDGGYILISVAEMITKKRMKPKTMEKLIFPFVILLIAFFVYVTYQDIMRIFTQFFK